MKRNLLFFLSLWALCAFTTTAVAEEVDYTSSIVNADLSTTDAWNTEGTKGIKDGMVKVGSQAVYDFSQTITIPAGQYKLTAKAGRYDDNDPIGVLDVTILSNLVLDKILGIKDLRTDKRIDFVGGIRGLGELSRRVDNGEMAVAFALYPVSMKQLIDIADSGNIMPPKTTWFEPKLRSGLAIHKLS